MLTARLAIPKSRTALCVSLFHAFEDTGVSQDPAMLYLNAKVNYNLVHQNNDKKAGPSLCHTYRS